MKTTIHTYSAALDAIQKNGYLFNVGQIALPVLYQLGMAEKSRIIKVSFDSWPIRGFGKGVGEWFQVFELVELPIARCRSCGMDCKCIKETAGYICELCQ